MDTAEPSKLMLTVDYDRLGLRAGETLLDLGCGFGRHAFEALRRGANVVACDMAIPELEEVRKICGAMYDADEVPPGVDAFVASGDATRLPFADASFDRIIASEVLEHIDRDDSALDELARVLKPGGSMAVTVPAYLPERICWMLSDEYYAPKAEGGHVRIYREPEVRSKLMGSGLTPGASHRAHSLHAPYWWLRCAVGPDNDDHRLVRAYTKFLTWDIMKQPRTTKIADRMLNPMLGKSLVVYATKAPFVPAAARKTDRVAA